MTTASPVRVARTCVFGAGQFGFALAKLLSDKHSQMPIRMYDPVESYVRSIQETRTHPVFFQGVTLGQNVEAFSDYKVAMEDADLIILAVPGQFTRNCVRDLAPVIKKEVILLNVAKALEPDTKKPLSEVVVEEMKACKHPYHFAALAGGMIADEVARQWPIAANVACEDIRVANHLQEVFSMPTFKVNPMTDVLGIELAGALKNVVAIGAGFFDGLKYEASSKAAFVSEAAREVRELAIVLGAERESFDVGTHAWLGDLLTTCFGQSRNRLFGELIGSGKTVEEALAELESQRKRAEGYLTARGFQQIAAEHGLHTPALDAIKAVLFDSLAVSEAILRMFELNPPNGGNKKQ